MHTTTHYMLAAPARNEALELIHTCNVCMPPPNSIMTTSALAAAVEQMLTAGEVDGTRCLKREKGVAENKTSSR